jgi:hypothetical protein
MIWGESQYKIPPHGLPFFYGLIMITKKKLTKQWVVFTMKLTWKIAKADMKKE